MMMNKWITISAIGALAIGVITTGVLYAQENSRLKDAQTEIIGLKGNVSALESNVSALKADLAAAEGEVSTLETELAAAEGEVLILEADLAAAEGEISTLETELVAAEAQVSTLATELAAAETQVSTLEADLESAQSALQAQQDINSELSEDLAAVQDPRHFESLEELGAWLAQDDTDTDIRLAAVPSWERIFILQVRALRDGYLLPANFEDWDGDLIVDFWGNLAYIGDDIYWVWAVDDSIFLWAIDMPPVPLHPSPLD
jgi:septal ring factor EnvC (AmiA/AmiB activator)